MFLMKRLNIELTKFPTFIINISRTSYNNCIAKTSINFIFFILSIVLIGDIFDNNLCKK